jgi:hypothetical protein
MAFSKRYILLKGRLKLKGGWMDLTKTYKYEQATKW